jgi:hypothetical protein
VLFRVVLGASVLATGVAHADPTQESLDAVTATDQPADGTQHRVDGVLGTGGAGARYRLIGESVGLELQAYGSPQLHGIAANGLLRFDALDLEHRVIVGAGYEEGTTTAEDQITAPTMTTHTPLAGMRGQHRFLSAYINDTVRFIRALDVTTGLVVEQWRNLGGDSTITYGSGPPMDVDTPDFRYLLAPTVSVTGHLNDSVSLTAQTYRGVEEVGPTVQYGRWLARARAFDADELGRGVATEASVQAVAPVIATVGYVQTPSIRRAIAALTYSDPRIIGLTARYDSDKRLDALAVRRLRGAFNGFVGVADAFGSGRQVNLGVTGTFGAR